MALGVNGSTFDYSLLLIYRPRKDERPSWLTCSGRFTHISGHPSAAGREQDRESSPGRDGGLQSKPPADGVSPEKTFGTVCVIWYIFMQSGGSYL